MDSLVYREWEGLEHKIMLADQMYEIFADRGV
jgi:hypothetical protein